MNGAQSLLSTLQANGVDVCFGNPGTSEMHFVAALDHVPSMRGVLGLFEGVVTGAADGYARVTGRPAATLLHLGPGLGNGFANLHNARRAHVPMINVVGDHATYHSRFDAPLDSDIAAVSSAVSGWHRRTARPDDVAGDAADAVRAAYGPPGQIATLVLPADASWGELSSAQRTALVQRPMSPAPTADRIADAVRVLRTKKTAIILGYDGLRLPALSLAHRIGAHHGVRIMSETFPTLQDRGSGAFQPDRIIYLSEFAVGQLKECEAVVLVGAKIPVGFFGYPDIPSELLPAECEVVTLTEPGHSAVAGLEALCDELGSDPVVLPHGSAPEAPSGDLTTLSLAQAVAATLPADTILVDESNTGGLHLYGQLTHAAPHQLMTLTGGAIGYGLPAAVGAAIGGGGRRVLAIESDGSMMYTLQALWTMARESLDITVLGLSNRSYAILNLELGRVGATAEGAASRRMLDLDNPQLDLCGLAASQGVPAQRVTSADELVVALQRSYATPGPTFIEVVLPKGLG
ncbi:MAG: acetolactate synthase large subunit [Acidobacteria bacterium]|nr:acetolactate synthase large subunit [Acidobacteriota bacterium]